MGKNNRGVSLIELLVTIGIIVALCGIVIPVIGSIRNNGHKAEAGAEMVQLDTALIAFFTDNGYYPKPGLQEMVASLRDRYFNFDPKRLEGDIYKDPWGEPYLYMSPGVVSSRGYDLDSAGLNRSMSAGDSSDIPADEQKEIQIGQASGQGEDIVWGLAKPEYDMLVKAALSLLRSTDAGYELAVKLNIANVPIRWDWTEILPEGTLAQYDPETHEILLDLSFLDGSAEVIAAVLAHEATHLADHLASGDMDFDSITEEYDAKYNEVMVWKELTKDKTFENLNEDTQANVDMENSELAMVRQGGEFTRKKLRQRYPEWPEEDQWGDSYVVAKES